MSAAIIPAGGSSTVRPDDAASASSMQRVEARAVAQVITDRYAAKELKVSSPKSVCELPLMMAGLDRKPLPEGLASIMGSESAMVMESPPVLLPGNLQPTYPAAAVFSQLKGKAVVRAQVLANGLVGEAFLRQSTGAPVLDQAALATVRAWRFRPAHRNGEPVPAWVNVPIEYRNPS
jgi:TonB family protein